MWVNDALRVQVGRGHTFFVVEFALHAFGFHQISQCIKTIIDDGILDDKKNHSLFYHKGVFYLGCIRKINFGTISLVNALEAIDIVKKGMFIHS